MWHLQSLAIVLLLLLHWVGAQWDARVLVCLQAEELEAAAEVTVLERALALLSKHLHPLNLQVRGGGRCIIPSP